MTVSLDIKTNNYEFIEVIKQMAKLSGSEVIEKKRVSELDEAIEEIKNGEYEIYDTFEKFEASLNA